MFKESGIILDPVSGKRFMGSLCIDGGRITAVIPETKVPRRYITPGLVDAHVHVESSLCTPHQLWKLLVSSGTVAVVACPHEAANVCGVSGIDYMVASGKLTPFKFFWGAPPNVPSSPHGRSGAVLNAQVVGELLKRPEFTHLSEVMWFQGVLNDDPDLMAKIAAAKEHNKRIDGHAVGETRDRLRRYISSGISSCHESVSLAEAREKAEMGMKVWIREGSAARNFDDLVGLFETHPQMCGFCTDDCHASFVAGGHINSLVARAVGKGVEFLDVLRAASVNVVRHYGLPVGLLQVGDSADYAVWDDLGAMHCIRTVIGGQVVYEEGVSRFETASLPVINNFARGTLSADAFAIRAEGKRIRVIGARGDQLLTEALVMEASCRDGWAVADPSRDLLKIAVVNRYNDSSAPAVGFIRGLEIKGGSMASSVAHDCHNIVVAGTCDEDMIAAANMVISSQGGLAIVRGKRTVHQPLNAMGLMSDEDAFQVACQDLAVQRASREILGSGLPSLATTLSFMALEVIPRLKLPDTGLYDAEKGFVKTFV